MWLWGAFSDNDTTQAHWAKYNYTAVDAMILIIESLAVAALLTLVAIKSKFV